MGATWEKGDSSDILITVSVSLYTISKQPSHPLEAYLIFVCHLYNLEMSSDTSKKY